MRRLSKLHVAALSVGLCCGVALAAPESVVASAATGVASASVASAASAQLALPDGRVLQIGGTDTASADIALVAPDGKRTLLPAKLAIARSGHTVTLLPDGRMLVAGGWNANKALTASAELYDPASQQLQSVPFDAAIPRAQHTATVLSNGRVLLAGGVDARGQPIAAAELWNAATQRIEALHAAMQAPRIGHRAALLPSGDVLVWGGRTAAGATAPAEVYDAQAQRWSSVNAGEAQTRLQRLEDAAVPALAWSAPAADARDVATQQPLVVRFSKRMDAASLASSLTLIGPQGAEALRAIAVEQGVLVYVWPQKELLPASRYTLFVNGAADSARRRLALTAIGFDTAAQRGAIAAPDTPTPVVVEQAPDDVQRNGRWTQAPAVDPQVLAEMARDDELWVPTAQDRRGEWLSNRTDLALQALPRRPELRQALYGARERELQLLRKRAEERGLPFPADGKLKLLSALEGDKQPSIAKLRTEWADIHAWAQTRTELPAGPGGTTALAGQVLRLNGKPLANVTLRIGRQVAHTDDRGEFLLADLPQGEQVLAIDGTSANRSDARYGYFEYRVDLRAGKTNLLPFVVWMPKLDTRHMVRIDAPTTRETVITNPLMPGLEVRLPAGTVLRGPDGKIVTEVSLTPVPVDQSPFPMPYFGVPINFTLQPGGTLVQGVDGKPRAATLRYPNYTSFGPGTYAALYDYDPKGRGWYVYAEGGVSADGRRVESQQDFQIYQFTVNSVSSGGPPRTGGDPTGDCGGGSGGAGGGGSGSGGWSKAPSSGGGGGACVADPVDLTSGQFVNMERDLYLPDPVFPIDIVRTYNGPDLNIAVIGGSAAPVAPARIRPQAGAGVIIVPERPHSFGMGQSHAYEMYLLLAEPTNSAIHLYMANGRTLVFNNVNGNVCCYKGQIFKNTDAHGEFHNAYIAYSLAELKFIVYLRDGRRWGFTASLARLAWLENASGARTLVERAGAAGYASRIISPNGRYVSIAYNSQGLIDSMTDNTGRRFSYTYDGATRMTSVTDPTGKTREYTWGIGTGMKTVTDPNGNVVVRNIFDQWGRVGTQQLADGSVFEYTYEQDGMKRVTAAEVRAAGQVRRVELNFDGYITKETFPLGAPEERINTYEVSAGLRRAVTDGLGRRTTFEYDLNGNMTKVTRLAGTPNAVSAQAVWDLAINRPLSITDFNGNKSTYAYDARGRLLKATNPLNQSTSYTYDDQGRTLAATNALGKRYTYAYANGDLASFTDPLNRKLQVMADSAGRTVAVTDPMGQRSYQKWDVMNRLTQVTEKLGQTIGFEYDDNGFMRSHTDPLGNVTRYTYDPLGNVASKTDALGNVETAVYATSKLLKRTDRKGQVSGVTYDAAGRVKTVGFGATVASPEAYTSTVTLTWDTVNRLTQIDDSAYGTIRRTYDDLDRMTREVTPQGEVNYTYDTGGRRTSMQIKNGAPGAQTSRPLISYTWDAADRLTKITQAKGSINNNVVQTIKFTYDAAGRRTLTTLANGSTQGYTYDAADQLTAIQYKKADGTSLGDLTYTYDANGRRTTMGGSMARLAMPDADVTDAAYNANNQLTRWRGKTFSYDTNGSLVADGTNTYQWDERNQLKGISTGVTPAAAFQYDTLGRRSGKTIAGVTTGFLYGGLVEDNFAQELLGTSNTSAVKSHVISADIDETLLRETSGQLQSFLTDGNNNTLSLFDAAQAKVVDYSYEPYGKTAMANGTSDNAPQYTGRENDGLTANGLYYYRTRYYMPDCGRFISEDPIGWASGQTNNYAYVSGNPLSYTDPFGLAPGDCYRTPDDAGRAAGIYGQSQKQNLVEWGGWIYPHPSGTGYTYSVMKPGTPGSIPVERFRETRPTNGISAWHTHPSADHFKDHPGNNILSPSDIHWGKEFGGNYLTGPDGITRHSDRNGKIGAPITHNPRGC